MRVLGLGRKFRNTVGSTVVRHEDGRCFWVSTLAPVRGKAWYDTLIFPCDEQGRISDIRYVYQRRYETLQDAIKGHQEVINHLEVLLWS